MVSFRQCILGIHQAGLVLRPADQPNQYCEASASSRRRPRQHLPKRPVRRVIPRPLKQLWIEFWHGHGHGVNEPLKHGTWITWCSHHKSPQAGQKLAVFCPKQWHTNTADAVFPCAGTYFFFRRLGMSHFCVQESQSPERLTIKVTRRNDLTSPLPL